MIYHLLGDFAPLFLWCFTVCVFLLFLGISSVSDSCASKQAVMSGSDIVAYKVRYPDGTQDCIGGEDL